MSTATSAPASTGDLSPTTLPSTDALAADRLAQHLAAGATRWLLVVDPGLDAFALATALDAAADDPDRTTHLAGQVGLDRLRHDCTPDDVVVLVATEPAARDTSLRLTAWGPTTLLLPLGATRPEPGLAHLVLPSADDGRAAAARLGRIGARLAQRGVAAGPPPSGERGETCITCADEAIVAEVATVTDELTVTARTPDGLVEVDTTLVEPPAVHDLLLVHARTAIAVLDPTSHTAATQHARRGLDEA